jgi:hypothetical protein
MILTRLALLLFSSLAISSPQTSQSLDRVKDVESIQRAIEENTLDDVYRRALKLGCQNHATLTYAALSKGQKQAILQVFGNGCGEQRSIFVFEQRGGFWTLVSDLRLSSHYDEQPTVTFPSLTDSDTQDIMVEHQIVDWGTGFGQKNIMIFKWNENHFEVVLDEPEWVHISVPSTSNSGRRENYDLEQRSTFEPKDSEASGVKQLTERQTVRQKNKEIIRTRNWIWDPTIKRFRCFEAVA